MIKILMATGLLAAGALTSTMAMAAERISYDYVGAQFISQNIDGGCDPDGLQLYGNTSLNSSVFLHGSLSDVSDGGCGSTNLSAAIGYHTLFGADSSIYGLVGIDYVDVDHGGDDNGLRVSVGVRGFVAHNLEGKVEVSYHSIFDGNATLTGGVSYWLNRNVSLVGELTLGTDVSTIAAGARYHF